MMITTLESLLSKRHFAEHFTSTKCRHRFPTAEMQPHETLPVSPYTATIWHKSFKVRKREESCTNRSHMGKVGWGKRNCQGQGHVGPLMTNSSQWPSVKQSYSSWEVVENKAWVLSFFRGMFCWCIRIVKSSSRGTKNQPIGTLPSSLLGLKDDYIFSQFPFPSALYLLNNC